MRKVFVTYNKFKRLWKVTDLETNKVIEEVDDVLLFNAIYKRHKEVKGWHGILSETINLPVIYLLTKSFQEIKHIPKRYYPRLLSTDNQVKQATFLRLKDDEMFMRGSTMLQEYSLDDWCEEYYEEEDEDNAEAS